LKKINKYSGFTFQFLISFFRFISTKGKGKFSISLSVLGVGRIDLEGVVRHVFWDNLAGFSFEQIFGGLFEVSDFFRAF
jgi:hypothetical protein